tara:strand:- start:515 stop:715 length:201 start_codon:yes stop_codon:yes gene_type:complete
MTKQIESSSEEVIQWLNKHLDDCPCDWHTNDYSEQLTVVFNTNIKKPEPYTKEQQDWMYNKIPERY